MKIEAKQRLVAAKDSPAVIKDLERYVTMNMGKFDGPHEDGCMYQVFSKDNLKGSKLFTELANVTKSLEKSDWKATIAKGQAVQAYKRGKVLINIHIMDNNFSFDVMADKPEYFEKM